MGFTKLDSGIVDSSIWSEPLATRVVWITFLAKSNKNGFVSASHSGMIRASNVTNDEFERAISALESDDPDSRTKDFDGRRIEKVEGGWNILNYKKYRQYSYSDDPDAVRKREYRDRVGRVPKSMGHSASASASASDVLKEGDYKGEQTEGESNGTRSDNPEARSEVELQGLDQKNQGHAPGAGDPIAAGTTGNATPEPAVCTGAVDTGSGARPRRPAAGRGDNHGPTNRAYIIPPKTIWIVDYCQSRKNSIDTQQFFDFYESKNWMIGKNRMKNWEAAVRTWEKNDTRRMVGTLHHDRPQAQQETRFRPAPKLPDIAPEDRADPAEVSALIKRTVASIGGMQ